MEQIQSYSNQKQVMPSKPERGLFTPDDVIWKVHREMIVMLAGSRALLLELAHPAVAAGVAQHSDYRHRPLHRLFNTLRVMQKLSFGGAEMARSAAKHINHCHHHVNGEIPATGGHYHAGAAYTAADPALRLWVFATLVESTLITYNQFMPPLTEAEQADYYCNWKIMGRMMGIPASLLPEDYAAFQAYVNTVLTDGTLYVSDTSRAIMRALFSYPVIGLGLRLVSIPGIGLMPATLREAYGYRWTPRNQKWLDRIAAFHRRIRPSLPALISVQPDAWIAEMRLRFSRQ